MSFRQELAADPISAVANAVSDLSLLVTKALPSEEQQLAAFKLRSPKIYARIMNKLFNVNLRFLKKHERISIDSRVELVNGNLPESARAEMKKMLHEELQR